MEILENNNEQKPDLLSSLKAKLEAIGSLELPLTSGCCIYKVPPKIRKVNEEAYIPTLVSIGPFHHGDEIGINGRGQAMVPQQLPNEE